MARHVTVTVRPRAGLRDPQGSTIHTALGALGYTDVAEVHVGRTINLVVEGDDETIPARVDDMCRRILANPVIEDYTIAIGDQA